MRMVLSQVIDSLLGVVLYALINKQLFYSFNSCPYTFALSIKCLDGVPRGRGYPLWGSRSTPRLLGLPGQPWGRSQGRTGGPGRSQGLSGPPGCGGDGEAGPGQEERSLPGDPPRLQHVPQPAGRCSWLVGRFAPQGTPGKGALRRGAAGTPQGSARPAGRSHLCLGLPRFSHIPCQGPRWFSKLPFTPWLSRGLPRPIAMPAEILLVPHHPPTAPWGPSGSLTTLVRPSSHPRTVFFLSTPPRIPPNPSVLASQRPQTSSCPCGILRCPSPPALRLSSCPRALCAPCPAWDPLFGV